ncbi:hypothetical protein RCO28_37635 [Streptomyces sp. LHD-70]|uniref:hypothetical protein n=1 Tax=Streptomyces sp. LHD-70 TaxID=3072140 RepID=UPI00280D2DC4|nr:hypothetical protein [Streptomyces sp. LHD-70]MDQ8708141.1 hypothetical protein [Streptomyces sp. LHD-70]
MPDMSASAAANLAMTHLVPLAKEIDEDKVTPGVLGFIVFAALAVGVWMLMKSMNRHMGRVNFEEAPAPEGASAEATAGAEAEGGKKQ